jgi:hypothetical protein
MKKISAFIAAFLLVFMLGEAQTPHKISSIQDLPSLLKAPNNAGTEFYFSFPPIYEEESPGNENNCKVFVASSIQQSITVEVPGKNWKQTKVATANDVIEFTIPTAIAQPFLCTTIPQTGKGCCSKRTSVPSICGSCSVRISYCCLWRNSL